MSADAIIQGSQNVIFLRDLRFMRLTIFNNFLNPATYYY